MNLKTAFNWQANCIYHIFLNSFGTFKEIKNKLSYIKDLGCNIVWLSPFFDCHKKDESMNGYDVINFYKINPLFSEKKNYDAAEEELSSLVDTAHKLQMKILFDFIPNHTSIYHPWFIDESSDYYIFSEEKNIRELNNYGYCGWNYSSIHNKYYYSYFTPDLADLNYKNLKVQKEIINAIIYWLDYGFDGVRIDAAQYIFKDKNKNYDSKKTHNFYRRLKSIINEKYLSTKILLGAIWIDNDRKTLNSYFGTRNQSEFDILLDFDQGWRCVSTLKNETDNIKSFLYQNPTNKKSYGVFLNNHDSYYNRIGTELNNNSEKIKISLALNILRPNIPIIYYGTEIGLKNGTEKDGYDLYRGKMPWKEVAIQVDNPTSILNFTKLLISFRMQYPDIFSNGILNKLKSLEYYKCGIPKEKLIAYIIKYKNTEYLLVYNITSTFIDNFKMDLSYVNKKKISFSKIFSFNESSIQIEIESNSIIFSKLPALCFSVFKIHQ